MSVLANEMQMTKAEPGDILIAVDACPLSLLPNVVSAMPRHRVGSVPKAGRSIFKSGNEFT